MGASHKSLALNMLRSDYLILDGTSVEFDVVLGADLLAVVQIFLQLSWHLNSSGIGVPVTVSRGTSHCHSSSSSSNTFTSGACEGQAPNRREHCSNRIVIFH